MQRNFVIRLRRMFSYRPVVCQKRSRVHYFLMMHRLRFTLISVFFFLVFGILVIKKEHDH